MADDPTENEEPAWRAVARQAAFHATLNEARARWEIENPNFNYRWEHVRAVVRLALRLAELTGADAETVEAAAWLHDICKKGRDDDHGQMGALAAREVLVGTDFPAAKIEAVADAISKHVGLISHDPIAPLEAEVLWDADKLSKMGATAVLHFSGFRIMGGETSTEYLLERLPAQPWQPEAVESLHTEPARAAGRKRLQAFIDFWQQAQAEFDGDDLL